MFFYLELKVLAFFQDLVIILNCVYANRLEEYDSISFELCIHMASKSPAIHFLHLCYDIING